MGTAISVCTRSGGGDRRHGPGYALCHDTSAARAKIAGLILVALLEVDESFRHFDIRSPGIFDKRDRDAKLRHPGVRAIQFDSLGFELLRERLEF